MDLLVTPLAHPPVLVHPVKKQLATSEGVGQILHLLRSGEPPALALPVYEERVRTTTTSRDVQFGEQIDVQITELLNNPQISGMLAAILFERLAQKALALTLRHEYDLGKQKLSTGEPMRAVHNCDEVIAFVTPIRVALQQVDDARGLGLVADLNGAMAAAQRFADQSNPKGYWAASAATTHTVWRGMVNLLLLEAEKVGASIVDRASWCGVQDILHPLLAPFDPGWSTGGRVIPSDLLAADAFPRPNVASLRKRATLACIKGAASLVTQALANWEELGRFELAMQATLMARTANDLNSTCKPIAALATEFGRAAWSGDHTSAARYSLELSQAVVRTEDYED